MSHRMQLHVLVVCLSDRSAAYGGGGVREENASASSSRRMTRFSSLLLVPAFLLSHSSTPYEAHRRDLFLAFSPRGRAADGSLLSPLCLTQSTPVCIHPLDTLFNSGETGIAQLVLLFSTDRNSCTPRPSHHGLHLLRVPPKRGAREDCLLESIRDKTGTEGGGDVRARLRPLGLLLLGMCLSVRLFPSCRFGVLHPCTPLHLLSLFPIRLP